jgi:Na+-driven multidrug efflux pump
MGELLALAWPLIVSNSFWTLQIALDRILLSRHSAAEVAAAMPAAILFWTPFNLIFCTASYATTFVAQYTGAARPERVGPVVWQSIYFSIFAGLAMCCSCRTGRPSSRSAATSQSCRCTKRVTFSACAIRPCRRR